MNGKEDADILEYFRKTAFPSENESKDVYDYIVKKESAGLYDIVEEINIQHRRIENALKFLENEGFIYKEKSKYYPSTTAYYYNKEHYESITKQREVEFAQYPTSRTLK